MMHGPLKILGNENCRFSKKKFKNCTTSNISRLKARSATEIRKKRNKSAPRGCVCGGQRLCIFYAVAEIVLVFRSEP